ncbi:MAG: PEP/pyruvate-binding domain-containing protein, partial [Planctomycetota bacterium]
DAIQYRRLHNLLDHDERMGVMIQAVVGARYGRYFLPRFAGVAFSRNDYRWSQRIRREDGLMRIVLGLGTRAVDRVEDFPRMVALTSPTLRPETTPEEIDRTSQKKVDVIDLEGVGFRSVPVAEVLEGMRDAGIDQLVSIRQADGSLACPIGSRVTAPAEDLCVTFERLLVRKDFPRRIAGLLRRLEKAYGCPVDVEFAVEGERLYLLQCRPLGTTDSTQRVRVPAGIPAPDRLFSASRNINSGSLTGIEYIVLVDPRDYRTVDTVDRRIEIARCVGRVNDALAGSVFILMGPGRWGSQDIQLGVAVTYADICNTKALVEIARDHDGYTPEPSFGTHFFQELVEDRILYLPLYPDEPGEEYQDEFFRRSPNVIERVSARDAGLARWVRVIDVAQVRPGRGLNLALDGEAQFGLCYLH